MPTTKRISGDYNITTINPVDNVTVTTNTLTIVGNLDVSGNLTYINVEELNVRDPFILLNSSNTSTYSSNSGVLTHKTSSSFAGIRYNDDAGEWQISTDTDTAGTSGTWSPIASGNIISGAAGSNTEIQFNDAGAFGASNALTFDFAGNVLTLQGHEILGNIGSAPTAVANALAIYHNAPGDGETGLYVKSTTSDNELISKKKAIFYSLIF